MKKNYITTLAIILCVSYGVLSWDIVTHSEAPGPEDSDYAQGCSAKTSGNAAPDTTYDMCCIDYSEALKAAKTDWQNNLQKIMDQEKAASDMVADGYESIRTYNCWLEYICRAVQYSGHAPIESALGTGLTSEHLGVVPGCQKADNLRMESEYNELMKSIGEVPIIGITDFLGDKAKDLTVENKINYFPRCQTDSPNNQSPNITLAKSRFDSCKETLELEFGCKAGSEDKECLNSSNAFATLENVLQKTHGDQKASALEEKLGSLVSKMHGLEEHVNYLSNFLQQLDARFACYAGKCS